MGRKKKNIDDAFFADFEAMDAEENNIESVEQREDSGMLLQRDNLKSSMSSCISV